MISKIKIMTIVGLIFTALASWGCTPEPPVITDPPRGERTSGPVGQAIACAEARRLGRKEIFCNE